MSLVKPIKEIGFILSKTHKEAKEEREFAGQKYPATSEKFILQVISCDEEDFDEVAGIPNGTLAEYEVTEEIFKRAKFGMRAKVKYTISQYKEVVRITPQELTLLNDKHLKLV